MLTTPNRYTSHTGARWIFINGVKLTCNDPDGWQLNSPTEIEFLGDACAIIENDPNVEITASWSCDAVSTPPPPK